MAVDEPAPNPAFRTRLRNSLISSSHQELSVKKPLLTKLKLAFAISIALIIAAVVFSNPKVVGAIRSIFYFIPGIGLTESNPDNYVVIPREPIIRGGVSFQVTNGVSTQEGMTLLLEVKGLSAEMLFTPDETFRFPEVKYKLNLDEKQSLELLEQSARWDGVSGYQIRLVFPPISENDSKMYLWLNHTPFANPDLGPNDIKVPIEFGLFSEPIAALPVIEIQSLVPTPLTSVSVSPVSPADDLPTDPASGNLANMQESQYRLEVLRMVPDVDGTIFMGHVYWTEDLPKMPRFSPLAVELRDINGYVIPVSYYQV